MLAAAIEKIKMEDFVKDITKVRLKTRTGYLTAHEDQKSIVLRKANADGSVPKNAEWRIKYTDDEKNRVILESIYGTSLKVDYNNFNSDIIAFGVKQEIRGNDSLAFIFTCLWGWSTNTISKDHCLGQVTKTWVELQHVMPCHGEKTRISRCPFLVDRNDGAAYVTLLGITLWFVEVVDFQTSASFRKLLI